VLHYSRKSKLDSLAEFSYNNSYQSSLKMAPFEALYGRRCRTPLNWTQAGEREIFGPDLVLEAEDKVIVIKKNLEAAEARQKSYHDKRRKCWGLVLKCYESRTRQHKMLNVKALRPSDHYFPSDIMNLGQRS
jgi:hypothetical protein